MSETEKKTAPEREELISFRTEKLIRQNRANGVLYWTVLVLTLLVSASAVYSLVKCIMGSEDMLATYINQIEMCVLALVCLNIPVFFQKKLKVRVPDFIAIIVYLFVFIHFVLGEIYRFYDHYVFFDKALHTTGGAVIAFVGFSVVLSLTNLESRKVKLSPFFIVLFTFASRSPSNTSGSWWNMPWTASPTAWRGSVPPPTCSGGKTAWNGRRNWACTWRPISAAAV